LSLVAPVAGKELSLSASDQPLDAIVFHSKIAPDFHASYRNDPNRLERVRIWSELLDRYAKDAKFAYDIGCGTGILACEIARRGIETIGIDGSADMLRISEQTARASGLTHIRFQQHRLPISDATGFRAADIVISSSVIEYLDSIPQALVFVRRLLCPEGVVIFSLPNRDSLSRKLVRWIHRLTGRPKYFGLVRHFTTVEDIQADLRMSGLDYVEHTYFARADAINRALAFFFAPKYSSNMILVVARRRR
jgi:2-polyprenyl-6-hydroxyphenyl methylase/3-demethylubiquinone-9 3-methyltransferase